MLKVMKFEEIATSNIEETASTRGNEETELSPEAADISKELELFRQNFGKDPKNNFINAYAKTGNEGRDVRTEMGFNLKNEMNAERFNGRVDSQELLEFIRDINLFYDGNDKSPLASAMGRLIEKRISLFIEQQHVKKLASELHDEWRESRRNEDGTFEPRMKKTNDATWINKQGTDEVDIANTSYENLPDDWKAENKASADVAVGLIRAQAKRKNPLENNEEFLENASEVIHIEWLERNKAWAPPEQSISYQELSEDEKEKDRVIIRKAIKIYMDSQPADAR
jgi:hypothetical protein